MNFYIDPLALYISVGIDEPLICTEDFSVVCQPNFLNRSKVFVWSDYSSDYVEVTQLLKPIVNKITGTYYHRKGKNHYE